MPEYKLKINGEVKTVNTDADTPLLWVLRDELGLTGTKFGCGKGLCGSCTVLINDEAERSCSVEVSKLQDKEILTIEGLARDREHPIFKSWIEFEASQCGYCQPGQIMTVLSLFNKHGKPSDADIETALTGVLCRCGTYPRIKKAVDQLFENRG
ncbi:MAG: (2Fe-2S)-binding protein [Ignavibacteriaceae bacterium]|nr:(2Fe-2S)-binding protein [Ignavibacteriaceae bacterium]NUM70983.1 (2Fe-2S)-binding protein [Ignavibacteriaceae bacterium]